MFCDWLATKLRLGPDRLELPVWLGKILHEVKNSRVTCDLFTTVPDDIRRHRANCDQLAPEGGSSCKLSHWQVKLTVPRLFLKVKSGRGACRFQWRVGPSYCECEYSGATYDLLVSNIGGTYYLADQLPINHEFGWRKSVPSPSGVRCKPSIIICSFGVIM